MVKKQPKAETGEKAEQNPDPGNDEIKLERPHRLAG
jgi:hypothetical protein